MNSTGLMDMLRTMSGREGGEGRGSGGDGVGLVGGLFILGLLVLLILFCGYSPMLGSYYVYFRYINTLSFCHHLDVDDLFIYLFFLINVR